jgi:hypothetical protein
LAGSGKEEVIKSTVTKAASVFFIGEMVLTQNRFVRKD